VRTKVDEELERAIEEHADDPERADMLRRVRAFKSSWLELGQSLAQVRKDGSWERWGHGSFEDYVTRELHLKRETAEKLTASFGFLRQHAPEVLERDGVSAPIPTYQAVDFLSKAYEAECPKEIRAEIRHAVLDEGATAGQVQRKYKDVLFPVDDAERRGRTRAQLLAAARRLAQLLAEPHGLAKRLAEDVEEQLGRLVRELQQEKPAPERESTRAARHGDGKVPF
jgi:hypothetical protein